MEMEIAKIGERGQIVIPQDFRNDLNIKKGEKFIVVKSGSKLIFQQMKKFKAKTIEQLKEDLVDIKIAEERLKNIERKGTVTKTKNEFLREMEAWVKE